MIYLYKKNDEVLYFKRKLEDSEVAMNKLEYQGKVTEEYYNNLIQIVSKTWHILKDSIERQLKERE